MPASLTLREHPSARHPPGSESSDRPGKRNNSRAVFTSTSAPWPRRPGAHRRPSYRATHSCPSRRATYVSRRRATRWCARPATSSGATAPLNNILAQRKEIKRLEGAAGSTRRGRRSMPRPGRTPRHRTGATTEASEAAAAAAAPKREKRPTPLAATSTVVALCTQSLRGREARVRALPRRHRAGGPRGPGQSAESHRRRREGGQAVAAFILGAKAAATAQVKAPKLKEDKTQEAPTTSQGPKVKARKKTEQRAGDRDGGYSPSSFPKFQIKNDGLEAKGTDLSCGRKKPGSAATSAGSISGPD